MRTQTNARDFDYFEHILQYHKALKAEGIDVDFVSDSEPLDAYKLVIVPTGYIATPEFATALEDFVRSGGVCVVTTRSGVKDSDNVCTEATLPGVFRKLAGVRVDEYEALLEPYAIRYAEAWGGEDAHVDRLVDCVIPESASMVASHEQPYLSEYAAVTENRFGAGRCYYVGACFAKVEDCRAFIARVLDGAGVARIAQIPFGVDSSLRQADDGRRLLFLMNHNDEAVTVELAGERSATDLLTGRQVNGSVMPPGGDVAVIGWEVRSQEKR